MTNNRSEQRVLRHKRTTKKLSSVRHKRTTLMVTKTNAHIFAALIDAKTNNTIAASSSVQLKLKNGNKENAAKVGTDIAEKAIKLGITEIAFDRGGSKYHGRIATLANAAREAGLKF